MLKKCSKCRRTLEAERFHKDKTKTDGLYTVCKDCRAGRVLPPLVPDGQRMCRVCDEIKPETEYYPAHTGAIRLTCKDCCEARWNKSYRTQPGRFPGHYRQSLLGFLSKGEQVAIRRSNPSIKKRAIKADRKYRQSKKGKQRRHEWVKNNYATLRRYDHQRKARLLGLEHTFDEAAWDTTLTAFGNCCAYCGNQKRKLAQDHWMPVIRGGHYVLGNIVPACKHCNSSKRDKLPVDFCSRSDYLRISSVLQGLTDE